MDRKDNMKNCFIAVILLLLTSCLSLRENVSPVDNFDINKYLGKWYEIARLDHSFERGLESVTAEYSLRSDGGVRVLNRGFSTEKKKWKEAEGRAYFVRSEKEGFLKVSFFGPFYGSYLIFGLDEEDYQYAFISGGSLSYLWLLSRTPDAGKELIERFVERAEELGYNTEDLIYVRHY